MDKEDKAKLLNDVLKTDSQDDPFCSLENNGTLRVVGRKHVGDVKMFFDRTYERIHASGTPQYTLVNDETFFHPDSILDGIIEMISAHKLIYYGSWRTQIEQAQEFFRRSSELEKKSGVRKYK